MISGISPMLKPIIQNNEERNTGPLLEQETFLL